EQEIQSLRSEFTVARVDASAAAVEARHGKEGAAAPPPPPELDDPNEREEAPVVGVGAALEGEEPTSFWTRPSAAAPAPLPAPDAHNERDAHAVPAERTTLVPDGSREEAPDDSVAAALEGEPTFVWTRDEAASDRAAAEAGGAHRTPQDAPRAPLSVAVAPPASAPAVLRLEAVNVASSQARPTRTGGAPSASTVLSHTHGATTERDDEVAEEPRDTLTTVLESSNVDGEEAPLSEPDAPIATKRVPILRPPAPLAHPDLIGSEDIAEEAAAPRLVLEEQTRRDTRAARQMPVHPAPKERGA
ncbi:MAG: hypothetical protein ACMG6S_33165, partial [Byssovorax sp.]